jgi:hypothetical protein
VDSTADIPQLPEVADPGLSAATRGNCHCRSRPRQQREASDFPQPVHTPFSPELLPKQPDQQRDSNAGSHRSTVARCADAPCGDAPTTDWWRSQCQRHQPEPDHYVQWQQGEGQWHFQQDSDQGPLREPRRVRRPERRHGRRRRQHRGIRLHQSDHLPQRLAGHR